MGCAAGAQSDGGGEERHLCASSAGKQCIAVVANMPSPHVLQARNYVLVSTQKRLTAALDKLCVYVQVGLLMLL